MRLMVRLGLKVSSILAALIVTGSLLAAVAAAASPTAVRHQPLAFPDFTDTSTCPGLSILVHLEGSRTRTDFYDGDGNVLRSVINVRYTFTFTNTADPSIVAQSPGFRHIELDYANNTYSDAGIYRNIVMPGEGNIQQDVGRIMLTLDTDELLWVSAHKPNPDDDFCEAMAG